MYKKNTTSSRRRKERERDREKEMARNETKRKTNQHVPCRIAWQCNSQQLYWLHSMSARFFFDTLRARCLITKHSLLFSFSYITSSYAFVSPGFSSLLSVFLRNADAHMRHTHIYTPSSFVLVSCEFVPLVYLLLTMRYSEEEKEASDERKQDRTH